MSKEQILNSWLDGAENATVTAKDVLKHDHRDWALFFCHLALEKILKAQLYKHGIEIPITHNLVKLGKADQAGLDDADIEALTEISTYNISARYDDEKRSFYKKATAEYTKHWFDISMRLYSKIKAGL